MPGILDTIDMIPNQELIRCLLDLPRIEQFYERGVRLTADPDVVCEADKCIELILRKSSIDSIPNPVDGCIRISHEPHIGLLRCAYLPWSDIRAGVTPSDRPDATLVLIGG